MSEGADRWIGWTTTGCVALLALIAGTVSYLHMHALVALHGPAAIGLEESTTILAASCLNSGEYLLGFFPGTRSRSFPVKILLDPLSGNLGAPQADPDRSGDRGLAQLRPDRLL
jgi:hypothetical protein